MSYDASADVERMIRAAGRCPRLTPGLRQRIIAESVRSRATVERRLRWDHTMAFCAVLLWLGIFIRQQAIIRVEVPGRNDFGRQLVVVAEFTKKSLSARSDSNVAAFAAINRHPEWTHVKTATQLRALRARMLRRCFGG